MRPGVAGAILLAAFLFPLSSQAEEDPKLATWVREAESLAARQLPVQAVAKCNEVITACEAQYEDTKEMIFCARTSAESLIYLMGSVVGEEQKKTIVIAPTWSHAYFIKAYALQEMGHLPEARENILRAVALSPANAQYLCELGNLQQLEKNWPAAKETFKKAEADAKLSPPALQPVELGRARRGYAYCLVEEGNLDGAEKIYQECLKTDPNDTRAKNELEYVQKLRAKAK